MSDTPDTQAPESSAPANSQQAAGSAPGTTNQVPAGYVPEARLTGALQKINELTLTIKALNDQLTASNTRLGELQAHGQQKETEWTTKVGETSQALQGITSERDTLKQKIEQLEAAQRRNKMIAELGQYELLAISDQIPVEADEAKQKVAIERLAAFAKQIRDTREQQLVAGTTITTPQIVGGAAELPSTDKGWEAYINKFAFGTPEREAAYNQYWQFVSTQKPQKA